MASQNLTRWCTLKLLTVATAVAGLEPSTSGLAAGGARTRNPETQQRTNAGSHRIEEWNLILRPDLQGLRARFGRDGEGPVQVRG